MATNDEHSAADEVRFMELVAMFQLAAMQQMGKLPHPVTNEVERNLDQARASIDLVEMLKRKTEGNRSAAETEFLGKVLFELQMNYVEEASRGEEGGGETGDAPDGDGEDAEEGREPERPDTPGNSGE